MRPQSTIRFEQFYLASMAVLGMHLGLNYSTLSLRAIESGSNISSLVAGYLLLSAVAFLFWFFIARRASNLAKWILVALVTIGLIDFCRFVLVSSVATVLGPVFAFNALIRLLLCISIGFLFRRDAVEWLRSNGEQEPIDVTTFN